MASGQGASVREADSAEAGNWAASLSLKEDLRSPLPVHPNQNQEIQSQGRSKAENR